MAQVLFVNFRTKEVSPVGWPSQVPIVGPVLTRIDGMLHFTADKTIEEIKALRKPLYQQLQIPHLVSQ